MESVFAFLEKQKKTKKDITIEEKNWQIDSTCEKMTDCSLS